MPRLLTENCIQLLHPDAFLAAHCSGGKHDYIDMPEVWFPPDGSQNIQTVIFGKMHIQQDDAWAGFGDPSVAVNQESQRFGAVGQCDKFVGLALTVQRHSKKFGVPWIAADNHDARFAHDVIPLPRTARRCGCDVFSPARTFHKSLTTMPRFKNDARSEGLQK